MSQDPKQCQNPRTKQLVVSRTPAFRTFPITAAKRWGSARPAMVKYVKVSFGVMVARPRYAMPSAFVARKIHGIFLSPPF